MLIKHWSTDGSWELHEAKTGTVTYIEPRKPITIDAGWEPETDPRLPYFDVVLIRLSNGRDVPDGPTEVRWVSWENDDTAYLTVTDGSIFVQNDKGTTVEALMPRRKRDDD